MINAKATGKIDFIGVDFRYPHAERDALSALNLSIAAGETLALVGSSGSGKTTLVNLIPRFYNPSAGEIRVDDVPLSALKLTTLRQHISMVSQDVTLFNDTVAANIAYGQAATLPRETIIEAARRTAARRFRQSGCQSPAAWLR